MVEAVSVGAGQPAAASAVSGDATNGILKAKGLLILMRHGLSMWNRNPQFPDNLWRYAGTYDVALATEGITDALNAGDQLADIHLDVVFCSTLSRSINTACIALSKHHSGLSPLVVDKNGSYKAGMEKVAKLPENSVMPVICASELNERCFGDLEGLPNSEHTRNFTGKELSRMRNQFDVKFPGESGESTKDVYERIVPYFNENILPLLKAGQNVLLCSHGFAIRALVKYMDQMSDEEFDAEMLKEKTDPENCKLLAATGVPSLYRYDHLSPTGIPEHLGAIDRKYELEHTCAPY